MQGKDCRLEFRHSEFKILPKLPSRGHIRYHKEGLPPRIQWTAHSAGDEREAKRVDAELPGSVSRVRTKGLKLSPRGRQNEELGI